jgi:hypothetical protein
VKGDSNLFNTTMKYNIFQRVYVVKQKSLASVLGLFGRSAADILQYLSFAQHEILLSSYSLLITEWTFVAKSTMLKLPPQASLYV